MRGTKQPDVVFAGTGQGATYVAWVLLHTLLLQLVLSVTLQHEKYLSLVMFSDRKNAANRIATLLETSRTRWLGPPV
jgi:hypothetical protein